MFINAFCKPENSKPTKTMKKPLLSLITLSLIANASLAGGHRASSGSSSRSSYGSSRSTPGSSYHNAGYCRASDGIGKHGLRSYLMGYGRGGPHGKVSPALQPAAESGHLTRAFDRASAHFGALREVSHPPDAFLPVAEDLL